MQPLSILYVDTGAVWRGGQEQVYSLIAGMKQRGHRIWLAAPPGSPLVHRVTAAQVGCFPFQQRSEISLKAFLSLLKITGRHRFDIIHFNTPRSILCGGLVARVRGIPVRICSRRVVFPLRSGWSRLKYNRLLEAIVTVSRGIGKVLVDNGVSPELIHVVHEGVDLGWIDQLRGPGLWNHHPGLVVGMVAHMSAEKGHETLLEAAAMLVSRFPHVLYVLVGEGQLHSHLRQRTKSLGLERNVVFTGFRSDSEALMKDFDLFCLPSLSEGLSSAILCAMASHLPVIATGVGGTPELVLDGRTGILVPPADPPRLAEALASLLSSSQLRRRLGAEARRRIETDFTLERKLDRSEELYRRLVSDSKPRVV